MLTPKRTTERFLAQTWVHGEWVDLPAATIWFDIKEHYAPDLLVLLYYPEAMRNPLVTSRYPGVALGTALADLAKFCGVSMTVDDHGALVLSVPKQVEMMKHGVVLEPDIRDAILVPPKFVD